MMLDASEIIARQLCCREAESFHGLTTLTPALFSCVPDDACLPLDGEWLRDDGRPVRQPGKVFYIDPEGQPDRPDWDRVTLKHLEGAPSAVISKTVTIPAAWQGKRLFLRFDAVYPAGRFFLDGELLGEHFSGLTPWECEVTGRAVPGRSCTVAVEILRRHPFVQLDMPRHALEFSGLAQPACLFATGPSRIEHHELTATYCPRERRGRLSGRIHLDRPDGGPVTVTLSRDGRVLAAAEIPAAEHTPVELEIDRPAPWSDEFPHLYRVEIRYGEERCSFNTAFRHLELSPAGPRLNGGFIKFRGVNHLTFHPEYGLYTPKEWLRRNLELMKKANVNAIRTHFAGPPALAELCDEMGFYLLQEIPIDWGTHFIHDPAWVGPALQRIQAVIRRDRHHPSLVAWCVGNENMPESAAVAEAGWHHLRIFERLVRELDPSRPAMFPPPGPANAIESILELRYGEIADVHYSFKSLRRFRETGRCLLPQSWEADQREITREEALARGWSGVWFSSEWGLFNLIPDLLNNPSGSLAADAGSDVFSGACTLEVFRRRLADEWGLMRGDPACLGGAYFPWLSAGAGAAGGNPWGWVRCAEDADWGVVTADLLPKAEFWALRQAFSPVHFPERLDWNGGDAVEIGLENQFHAIDLAQCTFRVQTAVAGEWMTIMRNFTDLPVAASPGARGVLRVPLTADQRQALGTGGAVMIRTTLLAPDGFRVTTAETLVFAGATAAAAAQAVPIGPDGES